MYAFVDETGNTGANIFDEAQPDFFTGALVTKTNFDVLHDNSIRAICRRNGIDALHASVIGFGPIEQAAPEIFQLLKKADARFFISRVEKRYLVATKVFDTFFDSGENPAAAWTTYNIRPLKLILCFKVASLLTDEIVHEFWAMLMERNEQQARDRLPNICDAILERVPFLKDARSRELVTDTLAWSRAHPEALDIFVPGRQAKNGHMPNMVAFANLLDGLEGFSKRWKRPLKKIVHDRQSQFEASLEEWHRLFSNASDEPIERPGETVVIQKVAGSTFEVSASADSPGIQVADLVLCLFRQYLKGRDILPGSAKLLNYAFKKGYHSDFSFKGVGDQLDQQYADIISADLSPEQLAEARRQLDKSEIRRQKSIERYEEDGLLPNERSIPKLISGTDN